MKKKKTRSLLSFMLIFSMLLVPFSQVPLQVNAAENETKTIKSLKITLKDSSDEADGSIFYVSESSTASNDSLDKEDIILNVTYDDDTTGTIDISSTEYTINTNIDEVRSKQGKNQELTASLTYKNSEGSDVTVDSTDNPAVTILPAKTTTPSKISLKLKDEKKTTFYAANSVLGKEDTLDLEDVELKVTFNTKTPKSNYFDITDEDEDAKYDTSDTTETIALPLNNEERFTVTTNIEEVRSKIGKDQTLTAELTYIISKSENNGEVEIKTKTIKSSNNDPEDDPKVTILELKETSTLTAIQLKLKDNKSSFCVANGVMGKDDTLDLDDLILTGTYKTTINTDSKQYESDKTEEKELSFTSSDYTVTTNVDSVRKVIFYNKKSKPQAQEITATLTYKDAAGKETSLTASTKVTIIAPKAVNGVVTIEPQNIYYGSTGSNKNGVNASDNKNDKFDIQCALDMASAEHKLVVHFPAGNYYLSNSLFIHSNTTLKFDNGAALVRNSNSDSGVAAGTTDRLGVNHNILKISPYNSTTTNSVGGYTNGENITIEGGTFDGGIISAATDAANIFNLGHANNITIKNCTFKNCYGNHLIELVAVQNAEITGCTFTGFRYVTSQITDDDGTISYADASGDLAEAIQIDVAHKDSKSSWTSAYLTDDTPCANINIHDNTFTDYPVAVGNHHALDGHHHTNITVSNNTITGSKSMNTGINMYGFDNSSAANNIITNYSAGIRVRASLTFTVSNNNISTGKYGVIETKNLASEISSGQIVGNVIDNVTNQGITIYGSGTTATTISQNKISNSGSNGIHINVGTCSSLTNNTISNCKADGIVIYGSANVPSVKSNTITTCGTNGIYVYSSATATTIKSNKISNCNKYGVYVTGSASVKTLSSNTITNIKKNGIYVKNDKIKVTFKSNKLTRVGSTAIKIDSKFSNKKTQKYTFAPKVISLNLAGGVMTTQSSNLKKIKLKVGSKSYTKSTKKKNYTFKFKKYTKSASSATVTFTDKNKNTVARVLDFE